MATSPRSDGAGGEVRRAIDVARPLFQPLLWLDDLTLAGYESLAEGPRGSVLQPALALYEAARAQGLVGELDAAMTRRSIAAVRAADWPATLTMFGNVEPEALVAEMDAATLEVVDRAAAAGVRIVVEITERSLLADPAGLIVACDAVRSRGWGIALDDVGVEETSLTLLPILCPDVVKLDMSILHRRFGTHAARVSGAVRDFCDHTGALMVCEGVENARHEARARALGADLVQGFFYGPAEPLPQVLDRVHDRVVPLRDVDGADRPAALESMRRAALPWTRILDLFAEVLSVAAGHTPSTLLIVTAPCMRDVPVSLLQSLCAAAGHTVLAGLIAPGFAQRLAPELRGADASMECRLGSAWSISVIGPTVAVSILAESPEADRDAPVRHRVSHDRSTVAHILRLLLATIS